MLVPKDEKMEKPSGLAGVQGLCKRKACSFESFIWVGGNEESRTKIHHEYNRRTVQTAGCDAYVCLLWSFSDMHLQSVSMLILVC